MPNVFEKFTTQFKKTIITSFIIAEKQHHNYIQAIHLLYGILLQKGSVGYEVLTKAKVTPIAVHTILSLKENPPRNVKNNDTIKPSLSDKTKEIITKAVLISAEHKHRYVGTEHLLSAIAEIEPWLIDEIADQIHGNSGKIKSLIASVIKGVSKFSDITDTFDSGGTLEDFLDNNPNKTKLSILEVFAVDLTSQKQMEKIDDLIGREEEVNRIIHILCRRNKNNPLLLGEPGVGKTAIVEGLAKKIAQGNVPDTLLDKKIWQVDLASLIAGTMYRGEFEARLKQIISEIKDDPNIILFIDEIHNVIGTGSSSGSMDTANILKPALARGEMKLIGATTFTEYKKHIQNDPAFERRLQPIHIVEPDKQKTKDILLGVKASYEKFHNVDISDDAIESSISLSHRYLKDKFFPDKALDLIDEASARLRVNKHANLHYAEIKKLERQIQDIIEQKRQAVISENYERAFQIKKQEESLEKKLQNLKKKTLQNAKISHGKIDSDDIQKIITTITGIPAENMRTDEKKKFLALEDDLNKKIIGQKNAIAKICGIVRKSRAGIHDPRRPLGSMLFVGPSGVGKTETAKALAQILFESDNALIRVDMSEYSEKFNISKMIGSPPGYVGYKETNTLTDRVRRNPYSIILFDEIEKAHPDVYSLLLQILEDGHITDASGSPINFKNTLIILTTNIGQHVYGRQQKNIGFASKSDKKNTQLDSLHREVKNELEKKFKPEFLNRLDEVIFFNTLNPKDLNEIAENQITELNNRLMAKNIHISTSDKILNFLASRNYKSKYGARSIRRNIQELIENKLAEDILSDIFKPGDIIQLNLNKSNLSLTRKKATIKQKRH